MIGHALVLFVFILSIKWGIWETNPADGLLGPAFFLAFLWASDPLVKIVKKVSELTTNSEEEK